MRKVLLLAVAITIGCCLLYGYVGPKKAHYPEPPGEIFVEGNKLFLDNILYAELRHYQEDKETGSSGIAIYYCPNAKEEWIFPKEGWSFYVVPENKKYGTVPEMELLEREAKQRGYTTQSSGPGPDFPYFPEITVERLDRSKVILMRGDRKFVRQKCVPGIGVFNVCFSADGRYVIYELKAPLRKEPGVMKRYCVKYGEGWWPPEQPSR